MDHQNDIICCCLFRVTSCKLWRQVGESFRPPKHCLNMRHIKCIMVNYLTLMVYRWKLQGLKRRKSLVESNPKEALSGFAEVVCMETDKAG
ncbi:hypothetical protein LINPERPRIM_LOCUS30469 [Linum perenne]